MVNDPVLTWLLQGDTAIRYQVQRDLLGRDDPMLRKKIANEGWGRLFLSQRNKNNHWGKGFYQPKWTCSHYTLLDLKNLGIEPGKDEILETLDKIVSNEKGADGGINPSGTINKSDVCINGMFLNYASYFGTSEKQLESVVDFLLGQRMGDGGFNCQLNRKGATHSSMHSTLSVLEGIAEYTKAHHRYRLDELLLAKATSIEFLMMHRLFRSDRTGKIIRNGFLTLSYPCRWYYDILRALDYFAATGVPYDGRMDEALDLLSEKKIRFGTWKLGAKHPGQTHFEMEKPGQPSRWNTLRALRVLKTYGEA